MDEFEYHSRRSLEELRIGLSATCPAAARAHLGLASLHLSRARLAEGPAAAGPRPGGPPPDLADQACAGRAD